MAQAVRRSPPTAGVPGSRLGHSMWVSWWTKRGLGRFFTGFLPFSPTTNFIPPFLHTHLIHFVPFHLPFVMVRQAWSAGTLATHGPIILGLHPSTRPCVGHELRIFIFYLNLCNKMKECFLIKLTENSPTAHLKHVYCLAVFPKIMTVG